MRIGVILVFLTMICVGVISAILGASTPVTIFLGVVVGIIVGPLIEKYTNTKLRISSPNPKIWAVDEMAEEVPAQNCSLWAVTNIEEEPIIIWNGMPLTASEETKLARVNKTSANFDGALVPIEKFKILSEDVNPENLEIEADKVIDAPQWMTEETIPYVQTPPQREIVELMKKFQPKSIFEG